ncbi:MAG: hypothetical protein DRN25_03385 [Thermoplasmata archaeon]|nr:MAG: hypothetical protein DRN25_03385 [Thermoplasmata archaeon]
MFGKKEMSVVFAAVIMIGTVLGSIIYGNGMDSEGVNSNGAIIIDFSFKEPMIEKVSIFNETYDRVKMSGLPNSQNVGEPCLPVKPVNVLLPLGRAVKSIHVTVEDMTFLEGSYIIEPGQQAYPISYNWTFHNETPHATPPDKRIYDSSQPYPRTLFQKISVQKWRGYKILLLKLFPVHYIPKSGKLYYYKSMRLSISTKRVEPDLTNYRGLLRDESRIKNLVVNPEAIDTYPKSGNRNGETYDYVVITNATFENAFLNLTNWKETRGLYTNYTNLSAKVVLLEDITTNSSFWYDGYWGDGGNESIFNDTQCQIRNFIKMAYNNWSTDYILLAGDADGPEDSPEAIIPHRGMYVYAGYYTDYDIPCDMYYGALDGNWNNDGDDKWGEPEESDLFAEVYIGRAPVDSVQEANNFVNKIIAYENATSHDETYLKKALMIGPQLDRFTEGGNSKDRVTEIIPQYTTTKVYHRDGTYSRSTIIQEMENGTHIVNYDGHSSERCFASGIYINDVDSLNNDKYFLVYSCGCYSASFDNRSSSPGIYNDYDAVGEHFVTASGGAFAYIGNSRYGWSASGSTEGPGAKYDRSFFLALMNNATNVGKALQLSKENLLTEKGYMHRWTYYTLNLLGDPETQIKTNLTAPTAHFSTVKSYRLMPPIYNGTIAISGTACKGAEAGATFSHYMIEYGAGLHPSTWSVAGIILANGGNSEVINGTLAYWNTTQASDGYYTLRLTVYDDNGKIGRDWFVVVISNSFTVHNINKDTYYNSIQAAIDDASNGDTIFAGAKTYYEILMINRSVNLVGESSENTIIDTTPCGGGGAITVYHTSMVNISGFRIEKNHRIGICVINSDHIYIFNNTIRNQSDSAIKVASSSYCKIHNNRLCDSLDGIWILSGYSGPSNYNTVSNNFITGCQIAGLWIQSSHYNTIYHNNFINNACNAHDEGVNTWDNGYPSGGNYWSDYNGIDENGDGIGDTPYNISGGTNRDRYPLMYLWGENPPVANFTYSVDNRTVTFNASLSYDRDGNIVNYTWDFGDGKNGSGMIVNHTYATNGTYNVTLTVMDDDGLIDRISEDITIFAFFTYNLSLYSGWNLITIPVENSWWASTLAENISGCEMISRFDALNQTFRTYIVGGPPGFDFPIRNGYGYFVFVNQNSTLNVSGPPIDNVSIPLYVGWNMIGWYHEYNTTASSLAENITNCTMVSMFDAINQTYRTYIVGGPPGFDFTVTPGMGVFVLVDVKSTWHGEG